MEIHFIFVIFTLLSEKLYIALNVVMDSSGSDLSLHWLLCWTIRMRSILSNITDCARS